MPSVSTFLSCMHAIASEQFFDVRGTGARECASLLNLGGLCKVSAGYVEGCGRVGGVRERDTHTHTHVHTHVHTHTNTHIQTHRHTSRYVEHEVFHTLTTLSSMTRAKRRQRTFPSAGVASSSSPSAFVSSAAQTQACVVSMCVCWL